MVTLYLFIMKMKNKEVLGEAEKLLPAGQDAAGIPNRINRCSEETERA